MYIKLFLLCAGLTCFNASPVIVSLGDSKIFEQIDSYMNTTCPAFRNNILVNKTNTYLSSCNDLVLRNPPERPLLNCIAIIASNIQLCKAIGNRQYNLPPNNAADLYNMVDQMKAHKPTDICEEIEKLDLFKDSANISYIDKWTPTILAMFKSKCLVDCTAIVDNGTNAQCSLIFIINLMAKNFTAEPKQIIDDTVSVKTTNIKDNVESSSAVKVASVSSAEAANDIKLQDTANLNAKAADQNVPQAESNPVSQMAPVQTPPNIPQPPANEITTLKLKSQSPESSNPQEHGEVPQTIVDNNSNRVNNKIKPETTAPEELTTHPSTVAPVSKIANSKPVEENAQIDISAQSQNDNDPDFTNDPSPAPEMKDNQEESEYDEDDLIPNENSKPAKVIPNMNDNGIYGSEQKISTVGENFVEVEDSNFFSYFMFLSVMFIAGYVVYHNKQKIMALVLEGRRDRGSRRRPSTSSYRKLNSNLEEAVTSKCSGSAAHVIY